ncbi:2OG-Fe dioxygenase family protein [Ramlibacter sp.]|uniref:2OG-Fe dioxygenase family protein n=1 Tax=Ramlibacter sp. TaxID=1917967 RepID=UPI0017C4D4C3|nr:2OG-Fe dioxygenase family protein [Ramlibacter sp.]MBA2672907.1 2OG-Fe dioxygenase family protein [Ramlibacter sp.]
MMLSPAYTYPEQLPTVMRQQGYAVLSPQGVAQLSDCDMQQLDRLRGAWDDLPPDNYLKDGGKYRRRRHSCFVVEGERVTPAPHRAHWQPVEYNALHGGMQRWFDPIPPAVADDTAWRCLLRAVARVSSQLKGARPWYVEAHQFRIDTEGGIGRPTPEGAHRDGVDMVAVFLVGRTGIKGGETRVFQADGPAGQRFTLTEPWSLLLVDDERVIHESTPIQPQDAAGHRDTLVLTYRADGFQGG